MKKIKKYLGAIIVATAVMALILPGSAVFTNNVTMGKNLQDTTDNLSLSAIQKMGPETRALGNGFDVLVSWDNPDEDDMKPKITSNPDGEIVLTYESVKDVLTTEIPLVYSDDQGETFNIQFLLNGAEYDGSGILESPDIKYCPARDEYIFDATDPFEAEYHIWMTWIGSPMADTTEIPIWRFEWGESSDYTETAVTFIEEWALFMNICTYIGYADQAPFLAYYYFDPETEEILHPNEVNPEWCAGIYYDGQSVLQTAPASEPEICTGQDRMYMVMESYNETQDIYRISYKATYTDLDPESDHFLFTNGGGPGGMDIWADIEVWPFQQYIAEDARDPDVSASGNSVAVVYSQDGDVKCKASNNNGDTFTESTVDAGGYPAVYFAGTRIYVAYVQNEDLYVSYSDNLGQSWSSPEQINDEDGSVAEIPGTVDLGEYGIVWTDTRDAQFDIFFEYKKLTAGSPPGEPTIDGPSNGDSGDDIPFIFSAVDPDGDQVRFHIDWGDGTSDVSDFVNSGADKTVTHSWTGNKDFTIKVQAEDSNGLFGPEETAVISIPRAKARHFDLFDIFPNLFRILDLIFG
jgi:hypothetical protein